MKLLTVYYKALLLIMPLTVAVTANAQMRNVKFGVLTGVDFKGVELTENAVASQSKYAPGFFGAIRVSTPISKHLQFVKLQFDLSVRSRSFKTTLNTLQTAKLTEREIQFDPIVSKTFKGDADWSPFIKGGVNVNYALKRSINGQEWKGVNNVLTGSVVVGFGIIHQASGFFSEICTTYTAFRPGGYPVGNEVLSVKWFPFAFNLGVGIFINNRG